ncbi:MAG: cytochrome c biogenesis protein CcdA [Acidobacteriota bacterium]
MADVSIPAAFLAGVISFLSPCVLPLVPGYLSLLSGVSIERLKSENKGAGLLKQIIFNAAAFVIGFSLIFIILGALTTWLGQLLLSDISLLRPIAGAIIVVFGLHLMGLFKIEMLYREKRFHSLGKRSASGKLISSFIMGLAFAFGWTPCIGPILSGILAYSATKETIYEGIALLSIYSTGMCIPFLLTALGINGFLKFYQRFKKCLNLVEIASGALLITIGLLIMTNNLSRLSSYLWFLSKFAK